MSIANLLSVVRPPVNPKETGSDAQWDAVQKELGIVLPGDFRDFGNSYGTGTFRDGNRNYLQVFQPFWPESLVRMRDYSVALTEMRNEEGTEMYPYAIYPSRPGLLVWGSDANSNWLYWLTQGEPEQWPVVVSSHECEWEQHDGPMTRFLARAFTRQIDVACWPDPLFPQPSEVTFERRE